MHPLMPTRKGPESSSPRMKTSALTLYNGVATCDEDESPQVISPARHSNHSTLPTGNTWTCQQNNANNAYYVTIPSANVNNNNKNNTYAVVPVAELDRVASQLLTAEEECFTNKCHRMNATRYHFHLSRIYDLAYRLITRTYKPDPSVCFALTYPKLREVFAAMYVDRIIHHLIAPFILQVTESLHTSNGNISHGNRPKLSAQTAAEQLQRWMREMPDGMVITMDIQGFFMNLARQMSFDIFVQFCNRFRPEGYSDEEVEQMLQLLHTLITNDPADGCHLHSPMALLDKVPKNKTLRNNSGKGLPIGNFYSQLIANMVSAIWGMILSCIPGVRVVQFVDDMAVVVRDSSIVNAIRIASAWILSGIQLTLHPTKFYCQPVRHGAYFCGKYVFANRIYTADRTIRACKGKIHRAIEQGASIESAQRLLCSINSYTGMMCHTASFNQQLQLAYMVLNSDFCKYLYFIEKKNHLVCQLFPEYRPAEICRNRMDDIDKQYKQFRYEYRSKSKRSSKQLTSKGSAK